MHEKELLVTHLVVQVMKLLPEDLLTVLKKNNPLERLMLKEKFGKVLPLMLDLHMVKSLLNELLKILKTELKNELVRHIHYLVTNKHRKILM